MRTFGMLPDSEVLSDYADRCLARPAFTRAMAREGWVNRICCSHTTGTSRNCP
jgi:hypothetical protein